MDFYQSFRSWLDDIYLWRSKLCVFLSCLYTFILLPPDPQSNLSWNTQFVAWDDHLPVPPCSKPPKETFLAKKWVPVLHVVKTTAGEKYTLRDCDNDMQLGLPTHCGAVVCNCSCLEIRMFMCLHRLSSQKVFKSAGVWKPFLTEGCSVKPHEKASCMKHVQFPSLSNGTSTLLKRAANKNVGHCWMLATCGLSFLTTSIDIYSRNLTYSRNSVYASCKLFPAMISWVQHQRYKRLFESRAEAWLREKGFSSDVSSLVGKWRPSKPATLLVISLSKL